MTKKFTYVAKSNGDALSATEWNNLAQDVDEAVNAINNGETGGGAISAEVDPTDTAKTIIKINDVLVGELTDKGATKGINVAISGNNNINIEPRPALGTGEDKNTAGLANRKGGNISLKPGDDIELCSHKRGTGKNTEVAVKAIDGSDNPVKLQLFAGDITLTTKDKDATKVKDDTGEDIKTAYRTNKNYSGGKNLPVVKSGNKYYLASENTKNATATDTEVAEAYVASAYLYDDPNVMNINVTTGDYKGYLKVRAQAIDLRCEEHGGIALQPKGTDGQGNMNKVKFEHGGGDGLEFATFNAEKTSIFTDEYRFNKDGIWKMSTRTKEISDKYDGEDETTHYKYVKQSDDFYDIVNGATATTEQIITVASKLASSVPETATISGYTMPTRYSVTAVTLSEDYADDSFYIMENATSTDLPQEGSYVLYTKAKMYNLLDSMDSNVAEDFTDNINNGNSLVITYVEGLNIHSYRIQKANAIVVDDILELVSYFKTNNQGPWANN